MALSGGDRTASARRQCANRLIHGVTCRHRSKRGIVAQLPPNRNPVKMASDYAFRIMLIFRNPERNPTQSCQTVIEPTFGVGDRLTVGQRTLTPPVLVRIQLPQPIDFVQIFTLE